MHKTLRRTNADADAAVAAAVASDDSAYITDTATFKISKIAADAKFTYFSYVVKRGGFPIVGGIIGMVPQLGFDTVKHIEQDSPFYKAAIDMGIDLALGRVHPALSIVITASEFCADLADDKEEYLQMFKVAHAADDAMFDSSDEMERRVMLEMARLVGSISKGVKKFKHFVAANPGDIVSFVRFGPTGYFCNKLLQRRNNQMPTTLPAPQIHRSPSAIELPTRFSPLLFLGSNSMTQQSQSWNVFSAAESNFYQSPELSDCGDIFECLRGSDTVSGFLKNEAKQPNVQARFEPQKSPVLKPFGLENISFNMAQIHNGVQVGVKQSYEPFGDISVGINIDGNLTKYLCNWLQQIRGKSKESCTVNVFGEDYKYVLRKRPGLWSPGEVELSVQRVGGEEHTRCFTLEWEIGTLSFGPGGGLSMPANQEMLRQNLSSAISDDLQIMIPSRLREFDDRLQPVLEIHDFDQARNLVDDFFAQYKDIEKIKSFACNYSSRIKDQETQHLVSLGVSAAEGGDMDAALKCFHKAQRLEPGHLAAAVALSNLHLKQGDVPSAIEELRRIPNPHTDLVEHLDGLKNRQEADKSVDLGEDHIAAGDMDAALKCFHKAQSLEPGNLAAAVALSNLHLKQKDLPSAIEELSRIPNPHTDLLEHLDGLKNHQEADKFVGLGEDHIAAGEKDAASKCFHKAKSLEPGHLGAARGLANLQADHYALFVNAVTQVVDEHIHYGHLHPKLETLLRTLVVIPHVNPRIPVALFNHFVSREPFQSEAWNQALRADISSNAFLVNVLLEGINILAGNSPNSRRVLSFCQDAKVCHDNLKPLVDLWRECFDMKRVIFSNSDKIGGFLLHFMSKYYSTPNDSVLGIEWTHERSDTLRCVCNIGILMKQQENNDDLLSAILAKVVVPVAKKITGFYSFQKQQRSLKDARILLLHSSLEGYELAKPCYNDFPDYKQELYFLDAVLNHESLAGFRFTANSSKGLVPMYIAVRILYEQSRLDDFSQLELSYRNHLLDTLVRASETPYDISNDTIHALDAKEALAFVMSERRYLNATYKALKEVTILQESVLNQELQRRNYIICLLDCVPTEESTAKASKYLKKCKEDEKSFKKHAANFSNGDLNAGFGLYLNRLCHAREAKGVKTSDYEVGLLSVLKYLYDESQPPFLSYGGAKKVLCTVLNECQDYDLKYLGKMLLAELIDTQSPKKNLLKKLYIPSTQGEPANTQGEPDHAVAMDDASISTIVKNLPLSCFCALIGGEEVKDADLLKVIMQEFMDSTTQGEETVVDQFRFECDFSEYASNRLGLISLYLSGMLAFLYMLNRVTEQGGVMHDNIKKSNNLMLDGILLRGYLPHFPVMMARLAGQYTISEAQAKAMLSWYDLKLDALSIRSKLKMLVDFYGSPFSKKNQETCSFGELCRTWGRIIRSTIYKSALKATDELRKKVFMSTNESDIISKAKLLLEKGVNPDSARFVHFAVGKKWPKLVALFCQYGADLEVSDENGVTPMELASICLDYDPNNQELGKTIKLLGEFGAKSSHGNQISFPSTPNWWWHYGGKSADDILAPHIVNNPSLSAPSRQAKNCAEADFPETEAKTPLSPSR